MISSPVGFPCPRLIDLSLVEHEVPRTDKTRGLRVHAQAAVGARKLADRGRVLDHPLKLAVAVGDGLMSDGDELDAP